MRPTLYIVDGSSYIFRAFYAVRPLHTATGIPTNAVFGFTSMLQKLLRQSGAEHIAVAFDPPKPSFRKAMSADYKAHRPPTPPDLIPQMGLVREMVRAFNIPTLELDGFEADDVIATLTVKATAAGYDVRIVSSDKDLMQLVDEHVALLDTMKDKLIGVAEVREKFGVEPAQVVDILGLMGDASDNIPGVPGIGDKTAAQLIQKYGSVEGVLAHIDEIPGEKRRENLRNHAADARLSRELAVLRTDIDIPFDPEALRCRPPDRPALAALLRRLEFQSQLRDLELSGLAAELPEPAGTPRAEVAPPKIERARYGVILEGAALTEVLEKCRAAGRFSLAVAATHEGAMRAHVCGLALSWAPGEAFYVPFSHRYLGAPAQLAREVVLAACKPLFEDAAVAKVGHDLKRSFILLRRLGLDLAPLSCDTMVAGYLLDPGKVSFAEDELARDELAHVMLTYAEVAGRGKAENELDTVTVEQVGAWACERAETALLLGLRYAPRIEVAELHSLWTDVELPLVRVLGRMELAGIKVDTDILAGLSRQMGELARAAEARIFAEAGGELNINSPKQLQELLFTRLGLKPTKKTQTGYSTDSEVLEELAHVHPLPALILEYRSVTKLRGTYVDALPALIHPETGRIHTSFNQAVAATGRLSSSEPNLQNIPIRSELGREIRRAFVAEPGNQLVSADYSQIELRLLAHASGDATLTSAFQAGDDIHARTAAEVFGVAREAVTPELRTNAKAINFGILYGMGAFRLARELRIPQKEAQAYIDQYFGRLPGVKRYIEEALAQARRVGYVRTLLGRRRFLPELSSQNHNLRTGGERIAINTPIQGSAADLIKVAMVRIQRLLDQRGLATRMLLQVHDELVFEAPLGEVEELLQLVRAEMEGVAELTVPLQVDVRAGRDWAEAH